MSPDRGPLENDAITYDMLAATRRHALIAWALGVTSTYADAEDLTMQALSRCWFSLRNRTGEQLDRSVRRTIVHLAAERSTHARVQGADTDCSINVGRLRY